MNKEQVIAFNSTLKIETIFFNDPSSVAGYIENGVISEINEASIAEKIMLLKSDEALQRRIKDNLSKKDYEDDYKIFCEKWKLLLS